MTSKEDNRRDADAFADHFAEPRIELLTPELAVVLTPPDWVCNNREIDLSRTEPNPMRTRGTVKLLDDASFIAFVAFYRTPDITPREAMTRIYVDADFIANDGIVFVAVLNDHDDIPQWRDHRAHFAPQHSVEWSTWLHHDRKPMSQADFATFVEDNSKDIATAEGFPTASEMLQMALNFEAAAGAHIKSAIRLQSGTTAFTYTDAEDAATVKRMEAFSRFAIGVPVFFCGAAYRLDARLKYRNNAGKLTFWFELIRPDLVVQDATLGIIAKIKEALPGVQVLMGKP